MASGTVADYTAAKQLALREKVATEMGLPTAGVALSITAASVLLTFTLSLPASIDSAAVNAALQTKLATPAAASTFLSTPSNPITVTTVRTVPSAGEGVPVAAIVVPIVVVVLLGVLVVGIIKYKKTRGAPRFKTEASV